MAFPYAPPVVSGQPTLPRAVLFENHLLDWERFEDLVLPDLRLIPKTWEHDFAEADLVLSKWAPRCLSCACVRHGSAIPHGGMRGP
eukprot:1245622-Lingulodinium_polyedra.AAC.1